MDNLTPDGTQPGQAFRFGAVSTAAIFDERVSPAELRVLAATATYADERGWCTVKQRTIADRLGISRQAVSKHQRRLADLGYLAAEPRYGDRGGQLASRYCVRLDPPQTDVAPPATSDVAPPATPEVAPITDLLEQTSLREPRAFEEQFSRAWSVYPRKRNKKGALRAYIARRREGVSADDLLRATEYYANARAGEDESYTMHGATFYGPNERWRDWLDVPRETSGPQRSWQAAYEMDDDGNMRRRDA